MSDRKISIQLSRDKKNGTSRIDPKHSKDDVELMDETEADFESGEISEDSAMSDASEPNVLNINLDGTVDHLSREDWRRRKNKLDEEAARNLEGSPRRRGIDTPGEPLPLITLAELNAGEVTKQLRYFHITKDPTAVDLTSTPAQCLKCAGKGHMSHQCTRVMCQICGIDEDHSMKSCPTPLQHSELLWRTSRVLSEQPVNLRKIRIGCYECGLLGHLGNDCPTRRPGKGFGTSSWSLMGRNQTTQPVSIIGNGRLRPKADLKIKGGARRQEPIFIDDESDGMNDPAHFFGSKVAPPAKLGQIKIAPPTLLGPRPGDRYDRSHRDRKGEAGSGYRDRDARAYGQLDHGPDYGDDPKSYGRPRQSFRPNQFQPPLPNEPLPERGNQRGPARNEKRGCQTYRPMPSSASNAWKKHTI